MIDGGVLISQDLSCAGQVSLSVALPILGACGLKPTVLPTAILSTHTGGFGQNTYLDLSNNMSQIVQHWQTVGLNFTALFLGYLGQNAIDFWLDNIEQFKFKTILIDPVMADHGKMYRGLDQSYVAKMRKLSAKATILTPNMTEAGLLLGKNIQEESLQEATQIAKELQDKLSVPNIVITGITLADNKIGEVGITEHKTWTLKQEKASGNYFGTGDMFASALLAANLHNFNLKSSCEIAGKFVKQAIINTPEQDVRFGPNYAAALPWLMKKLEGKNEDK